MRDSIKTLFEKTWDFGEYENFIYPLVSWSPYGFSAAFTYEQNNEKILYNAMEMINKDTIDKFKL